MAADDVIGGFIKTKTLPYCCGSPAKSENSRVKAN
jgi:hypothetical protein